MIQPHNNAVPSVIRRKLRSIRLRQTGLILLRGFAIAVAVFVAAMVLSMTIDWVFTLFSPLVRIALTGLAIVLAVTVFFVSVVPPLRRTFSRTQPAADADAAIPQLEERWTTVASFADSGEKPGSQMSQAMLEQVNSEAVAMQRLVRPSIVVRPASLKRPLAFLGGVLLLLAGFLVIDLPRTTVLVKRFLSPTAPITATQLISESGDLTIPRGEMFDIVATATGIVRESVTLAIKHESGVVDVLDVPVDEEDAKRFVHAMRADDSLRYQVTSGDARTHWHRVTVIDHPTLEEVQFQVTPPSYIDQPPIEKSLIPSRLRVPQGSLLEVAMKPTTELKSLTIDLDIPRLEGEPERKTVRLRPDTNGWYRFRTQLLSDVSFRPTLRNVFGLQNEDKRVCHIEVIEDRAPVARITNSDEEMAVAEDEEIEINFEAHDDHGIKTAELVIYDETDTEEGEEPRILEVREIPLGDQQDEKHVMGSTKLDLKELNLPEDAKISYSIRVTDNRDVEIDPDRMLADSDAEPNEESSDMETDSSENTDQMAAKSENDHRESAAAKADMETARSDTGKNDTGADSNPTEDSETESKPALAQSDTTTEEMDAKSKASEVDDGEKVAATESNDAKTGDTEPTESESAGNTSPNDATQETTELASAEDAKPQTNTDMTKGDADSQSATMKTADATDDEKNVEKTEAPQSESDDDQNNKTKTEVAAEGTNTDTAKPANAQPTGDDSERVAKSDTPQPMPGENTETANTENASDNDPPESTKPIESSKVAKSQDSDEKPNDDNPQEEDENNTVANTDAKSPKTGDGPQVATDAKTADSESKDAKPNQNQNVAQANASGNQKPKKPQEPSESGPPIPVPVKMTAQQSESGQNAETNKRKLKITKRLASVAKSDAERKKEQRAGIRQKVVAIDVMLAEVETRLNQILNREIPDSQHRQAFEETDDRLGEVETFVAELRQETAEGEFAFIGLQMVDITRTYVTPARDRVFQAIRDVAGAEAHTKVASGHITRARELLAALLARYDKVAQEKKLAESIEETVEIYEVYVEKMQKLMRERRQNKNPLGRAMAVIEVDQDYLDRLAEVVTLRREMMREFGRMLSDDPRLLARYMDLLKRRNKSLRDQLSDLAERQEEVAYELAGWQSVDEAGRADVWTIVIEMRLLAAEELSKESASLAERIRKQLPLTLEPSHPVAARVLSETDRMAELAQEVAFDAELFFTAKPEDAKVQTALHRTRQLSAIFSDLDAALDRMIVENEDDEDIETYVNARLRESRSVADQAERWEQIATAIQSRRYFGLNELDQWQLNTATELLRVEMLEFEDDLEGQFQQQANSDVPGEIVDMIRQLHRLMETITFNQSAATFALKKDRGEFAETQQAEAVRNFALAEDLFDKIRRAVIAELDQYDVDDPNIANLRDPTLDQFLANLEREPNIQAQLGIPRRPTNLRVRADNLFTNQTNTLLSSAMAAEDRASQAMKMAEKDGKDDQKKKTVNEMTSEEKEQMEKAKEMQEQLAKSLTSIEEKLKDPKTPPAERRKLEQMQRNLKRVQKQLDEEATSAEEWERIVERDQAAEMLKALAKGERIPDEQWNRLMSTLEDGLWQVRGTQPPEEYRKAIEQYQDRLRELMSTVPAGE
ncbi:hypothetical protein [Thalassoroseus pseudoceratinae]|uniref:hypothetical protein n=1 Tax=Thalassoroseus pseudoceratinae TaxID=2713176 RepID=UPI0014249EB8|nr:hypothetical protein [Thalassoroseus pseudoceratinae]